MVPHYVTTCDTLINRFGPAAAANSDDLISCRHVFRFGKIRDSPPQSHFPYKIDSRHAERNETKAPLLDHKARTVGRIQDEQEHVRPGIWMEFAGCRHRKTKTERRNRLVGYKLR